MKKKSLCFNDIKMMMTNTKSFLLLKGNLFDQLYELILQIDNDRCPLRLKQMDRYSFISIFVKALTECKITTQQKNKESLCFYDDYLSSNSIESFQRTILEPNLKMMGSDKTAFLEAITEDVHQTHVSYDEFGEEEIKEKIKDVKQSHPQTSLYLISNTHEIEKI